MRRSAGEAFSACASMFGDDEIDPLDVSGDHVGDGIAPRAADPDDRDARLQLIDLRRANIDAHPLISLRRRTSAASLTLRPCRTSVPTVRRLATRIALL